MQDSALLGYILQLDQLAITNKKYVNIYAHRYQTEPRQ